jgi:rhamnose transport system permease protein
MNKPYVHDGWVQTVVLWNTKDLGYLTVLAASLLTQNTITPSTTSFQAGRLGTIHLRGSEIVLGAPVMFTKANIDSFNF